MVDCLSGQLEVLTRGSLWCKVHPHMSFAPVRNNALTQWCVCWRDVGIGDGDDSILRFVSVVGSGMLYIEYGAVAFNGKLKSCPFHRPTCTVDL